MSTPLPLCHIAWNWKTKFSITDTDGINALLRSVHRITDGGVALAWGMDRLLTGGGAMSLFEYLGNWQRRATEQQPSFGTRPTFPA